MGELRQMAVAAEHEAEIIAEEEAFSGGGAKRGGKSR
jgi:hypothetical protein